MDDYLSRLVDLLGFHADKRHRYIVVSHLFDDTMRMLSALEPHLEFDAIFGIPYSSNRPGVAQRWSARFGQKVHIPPGLAELEAGLVSELGRSLALCQRQGQKLIVQDIGGFVVPLLHTYFSDRLSLVKGVVEITKQGVWRASEVDLAFPVLHCADSELKRLEAKRCGETIARCLDGVGREMGLSLAGRPVTVMGAGWIGMGVAQGLRRLDAVVELVDRCALKVTEARLEGFTAGFAPSRLESSQLIVGATGRTSITRAMLERLPNNAMVASASSRQIEIEVDHLHQHARLPVGQAVVAYHLPDHRRQDGCKRLLLVNDGFPANFIPGSGSVPDEIVETILGELIVLMGHLAETEIVPGIHRIEPEQEAVCAELWLELRDRDLNAPSFHPVHVSNEDVDFPRSA
ncbi:MAG: S-adenosylhomocysteine hydrolase [Pseudomonadota bacterium]